MSSTSPKMRSNSSKPKLSTSTLSLKFMQRANQRVELQAATVTEAEEEHWEVPGRDVFVEGSSSNPREYSSRITHETSYVPFLFPSSLSKDGPTSPNTSEDETGVTFSGRRSFNPPSSKVKTSEEPYNAESSNQTLSQEGGRTKTKERPGRLSSVNIDTKTPYAMTARMTRKGDRPSDGKLSLRSNSTSVLKMISDETGVGADMRGARASGSSDGHRGKPPNTIPIPTVTPTFLRPSGVDSPARKARSDVTAAIKRRRSEDSGDQSNKASKLEEEVEEEDEVENWIGINGKHEAR